ncbi:hypothetical protein P5G65_14240, partial [Paenibacillus chondroitinus]
FFRCLGRVVGLDQANPSARRPFGTARCLVPAPWLLRRLFWLSRTSGRLRPGKSERETAFWDGSMLGSGALAAEATFLAFS